MKKLLRFAGVALLALTIGVFGCGDDDDPVAPVTPVTPVAPPVPPPAPIVGTVSGTVSVEGSGLAGVTVNLSGAASQSAATGSSGGYSFANVPAGTHSVQISGAPAEVDFASTATAVTIATSGQTATADFSGTYIRESTITGSVTAGGEGVVATVTATGEGMLTDEEPAIGSSDTDGDFELTGLRAGTHMVTISDFGDIEFVVSSRAVTVGVGQSASVAFIAEAVPVTTGSITGQVVTAAGVGIVATVTAVGTGEDGATVAGSSDTEGDYELPGVEAGDYTVTISDFGDHEFTVSSRAVTVVAGQSSSVTFVAGPEPEVTTGSITGQVVTAAGVGIVATVTAVGTGEDGVTVAGSSDTEGDYELPGVEAGDYTVTISDFGDHEFAVSSRAVTVVAGQSSSVAFVAEDGPTTGTRVSIIITEVTGDEGDDKISGRVTATIDVERGEFEKIALYVDGEEVDAQLFGLGSAPAEEPALAAAQQSGVLFRLSFDSGEYDDEGVVTYPNEAYEIVAGVTLQGSTEEFYSNRMEVEFKNSSFVLASVKGLGDGERNSSTGQVWHGGPDLSVKISALAVSYSSGAAVSSVTLLPFCDDDAATDSEAPFEFPVDCDGFQSEGDGTTPMFNVGGAEIASKGGKVYLDFKAPDAPHFQPNPNKRELGWVNADVGFTAEYEDKKGKRDGWLIYHHDDNVDNAADDGVGEYTPRIRFAEAGADKKVGGALDAAFWTQLVLPPALAGKSSKANAYCVVVSAVDMLGNESKLPDADDDCVSAADYDADNPDKSAGLLAGVDLQEPTIAFSPQSPKENAATMENFQVQLADEGSGIRVDSPPLTASVTLRDKDGDEEIEDLEISVSLPLATTVGLPDGVGYYTFTALSLDKAGNKSVQMVRTAVHDTKAPELGLIVGGYAKGAYSLTATLTDDLSIKHYWAEAFDIITGVSTTPVLILPREGSVAVDDYDSADLTQSRLTSPPLTMEVFRALQAGGPGDDPESLISIQVVATDHGGNHDMARSEQSGTETTSLDRFGVQTALENLAVGEDENEFDDEDLTYSRDQVFQTSGVTDEENDADVLALRATILGTVGYTVAKDAVLGDDPDTDDAVEEDHVVTAAVMGVEGLKTNPVSRVDFYVAVDLKDVSEANMTSRVPPAPNGFGDDALLFIGSTDAAGARGFDDEGTPSLEYFWDLDMSGADLLELVDGDETTNDATRYTFVAFFVNSAGVAISATVIEGVEK